MTNWSRPSLISALRELSADRRVTLDVCPNPNGGRHWTLTVGRLGRDPGAWVVDGTTLEVCLRRARERYGRELGE